MKKLIQISLIAILVLVLFQAAAVGSVVALGGADLDVDSAPTSSLNASSQGLQVATCFAGLKGVICVTPNVGWNS